MCDLIEITDIVLRAGNKLDDYRPLTPKQWMQQYEDRRDALAAQRDEPEDALLQRQAKGHAALNVFDYYFRRVPSHRALTVITNED